MPDRQQVASSLHTILALKSVTLNTNRMFQQQA